jgi:hypothetical protein
VRSEEMKGRDRIERERGGQTMGGGYVTCVDAVRVG